MPQTTSSSISAPTVAASPWLGWVAWAVLAPLALVLAPLAAMAQDDGAFDEVYLTPSERVLGDAPRRQTQRQTGMPRRMLEHDRYESERLRKGTPSQELGRTDGQLNPYDDYPYTNQLRREGTISGYAPTISPWAFQNPTINPWAANVYPYYADPFYRHNPAYNPWYWNMAATPGMGVGIGMGWATTGWGGGWGGWNRPWGLDPWYDPFWGMHGGLGQPMGLWPSMYYNPYPWGMPWGGWGTGGGGGGNEGANTPRPPTRGQPGYRPTPQRGSQATPAPYGTQGPAIRSTGRPTRPAPQPSPSFKTQPSWPSASPSRPSRGGGGGGSPGGGGGARPRR